MSAIARDRELERDFLADHPAAFAARVIDRVDGAGRIFKREVPEHLSVAQVLAEIQAECEDIAGWSLMALHLAAARVEPAAAAMLRRRLAEATGLAADADRVLADVIADLPSAEARCLPDSTPRARPGG